MQPVQPQGFIPPSAVEDHKVTQSAVLEAEPEAHDPEKAQSQQELFTLGVRSGGVSRVQEVEVEKLPATEDRLASFMKGVIDEIGSEVQQKGLISFLNVTVDDINALDAYKERISAEEKALYTHFTSIIMAHYSPIISQLPGQMRPRFLVAIEGAIIPKMAHAYQEIAKISPEFLKNLALTASFHAYIARQGEVMQQLQALEPAVLKSLKDALTSDDKEGFIANSTLEAVVDLRAFLASVPEKLRGSLTEGFVVGIEKALELF